MNIHDRARQLVAQSPRPMEMSEAYRQLGRRRRSFGRTAIKQDAATAQAQHSRAVTMRLPYADN